MMIVFLQHRPVNDHVGSLEYSLTRQQQQHVPTLLAADVAVIVFDEIIGNVPCTVAR